MKTEEDEAFDELARKQGSWGGGYQAKRKMAADKLQEPACDKDPQGCWNVRCQLGKQCKNLAQPAQEPAAMDDHQTLEALKYAASKGYGRIVREHSAPFTIKEALAQPEQRPWVGLTAEEIASIPLNEYTLQTAERLLKEKNT